MAERRLFVRALEDQAQTLTQSHLQAISRGHRQEHLAQATGRLLPEVLRDLVGGLSGVLESEIEKLQYLGPLRSYPPRHLAFAQHHDPNWLAGGGYAWDEVRTNRAVRERVNGWRVHWRHRTNSRFRNCFPTASWRFRWRNGSGQRSTNLPWPFSKK